MTKKSKKQQHKSTKSSKGHSSKQQEVAQPAKKDVPSKKNDNNVSAGSYVGIGLCHHMKDINIAKVKQSITKIIKLKSIDCDVCAKSKDRVGSETKLLCCSTGEICCVPHSEEEFASSSSGKKKSGSSKKKQQHSIALNLSTFKCYCYQCECEIGFVEEMAREHTTKDQQLKKFYKLMITYSYQQLKKCFPEKYDNKKFSIIEAIQADEQKEEDEYESQSQKSKGSKRNWCTFDINGDGKVLCATRGLSNLGNTCFFNSVMQCFAQTSLLTTHYLTMDEVLNSTSYPRKYALWTGPLSLALKLFYEDMFMTYNDIPASAKTTVIRHYLETITPQNLFKQICKIVPSFRGFGQQDAQEYLRFLQNFVREEYTLKLEKSGVKTTPNDPIPNNIIDYVFNNRMTSTVVCNHCGNVSKIFASELDISVPIPRPAEIETDSLEQMYQRESILYEKFPQLLDPKPIYEEATEVAKHLKKKNSVSLSHCLWKYVSGDVLTGTNGYECDECSHKVDEPSTTETSSETKTENETEVASAETVTDKNDSDNETTNGTATAETQPSTTTTPKPKKVLRDAVKQFAFYQQPNVLTIHLKRFVESSNRKIKSKKLQHLSSMFGSNGFEKDDTSVQVPEFLTLNGLIHPSSEEKPATYRLYGVVEHSGSLNFGHYVAFTREARIAVDGTITRSDDWCYISDRDVRGSLSFDQIQSVQPYILFYEKV